MWKSGLRRHRALALMAMGGLAAAGCGQEAPTQGRLYVTSGFTDQVLVLDAATGAVMDSLDLDPRPAEIDEPHGVAVSPDDRHWYATVAHGEATLWKFESAGDRLVGRLALGTPGAARVRLTPDGSRAFVPDYWRSGQGQISRVGVVDLHEMELFAAPEVCPAPHDAPVSPDGSRVAVICSLSDEIVILDAASLAEVSRFPVGSGPGEPGAPRFKPLNAAWSADGDVLWVTLNRASLVRAFDDGGNEVATVAVADTPTQLSLTAGGAAVVVVSRGGGALSVIDTKTLEERRIPLPNAPHPHGVVVDPTGTRAWVSYEGAVEGRGGVVAVRLSDGAVLWRTVAGVYTLGIALSRPSG